MLLELLLNDPLIRQLAAPVAVGILTFLLRQFAKGVAPTAVETRVSQSIAAPTPPTNGNGNGYLAAITSESKRVDDIRDDLRAMEGRFMDKFTWLSLDIHESIDAQNFRIARLERTVASLIPAPLPPPGQELIQFKREVNNVIPMPTDEPDKPA